MRAAAASSSALRPDTAPIWTLSTGTGESSWATVRASTPGARRHAAARSTTWMAPVTSACSSASAFPRHSRRRASTTSTSTCSSRSAFSPAAWLSYGRRWIVVPPEWAWLESVCSNDCDLAPEIPTSLVVSDVSSSPGRTTMAMTTSSISSVLIRKPRGAGALAHLASRDEPPLVHGGHVRTASLNRSESVGGW